MVMKQDTLAELPRSSARSGDEVCRAKVEQAGKLLRGEHVEALIRVNFL